MSVPLDAELEDAFFELLARCDSPKLVERDAATEELTRRFLEFEPVWKERSFLTNGEISAESAQRFAVAEARSFRASVNSTLDAFHCECRVEKQGEGNGERRAVWRVVFPEQTLVVYLKPLFNRFFWRDPVDDALWVPVVRSSSPELEPERGAREFAFETILERVDAAELADDASDASEFELALGLDVRPFAFPIPPEGEKDARIVKSRALKLVATAPRRTSDSWLVDLRVDRDDVFGDLFDSHRNWVDANDFALASRSERSSARPLSVRVRDRNPRGGIVELRFPQTSALDDAFRSGEASVEYTVPRVYYWTRQVIQISKITE